MKCWYIRKKLLDYIDGNLSEKDSFTIEQHIAKCAQCRQEIEMFSKLSKAIHRVDYPPASVWDNFLSDLHTRIEKEAARDFAKEQKRQSYIKWGWVFTAATAVLFFVSSVILEYQSTVEPKNNIQQIRVQARSSTSEKSESIFIAEIISDTLINEKEAVELKKLGNINVYEAYAPDHYNSYAILTDLNTETKPTNEISIQSLLKGNFAQFDTSDNQERYNIDGLGTI